MILWARILNYQRSCKGTGMRLAVVHGIVENPKGAVWIESEPKKETIITVYFPSVDEDAIHRANF
jgi:signal transduction histidine kinase